MKSVLYLLLVLFHFCKLNAQSCGGSVGQNIFEDGDFGAGATGVVALDPMIAPGYNYTTNVPSDGQYSLVNNTSSWSNLYQTWIRIPDNSSDPNGYMMVVNASFEPGVFYEQEISGLCENTLYEFTADIINLISTPTTGHILPNVAFLIDDNLEYESGQIPQDERWTTYGFSFTTPPSRTSIKLTLRNNAPGGTGNDLALDNITFRPCGPSAFVDLDADKTIFLCAEDDPISLVANIEDDQGIEYFVNWQSSSDSLNWQDVEGGNGQVIQHVDFTPGDHFYRYFSSSNIDNLENSKCRVVSDVVKITILPVTYEITDTICMGNTYQFGDQTLFDSGSFSSINVSSYGCDSITNLTLVVVTKSEITIETLAQDPFCAGDLNGSIEISSVTGAYLPTEILVDNGNTFEGLGAGSYEVKVIDRHGCQETTIVNLEDPDLFALTIGSDTMIRLGVPLEIMATGTYPIETILWTYENARGCTDCIENSVIVLSTSSILAVATNDMGCEATSEVVVEVDESKNIFMPNVFSPNGDQRNDVLKLIIYEESVEELLEFMVFDRWGSKIVSISNILLPSNGAVLWDGLIDGQLASNGVYLYYVAIKLINGEVVHKNGTITVLR